MRVNARLDDESERQMKFLVEATGLGVSDVVKTSLAHYYQALRSARPTRLTHLRTFIGRQGSGRSDVSVRSKELFAEGLAGKAGPNARPVRTGRTRA
jgi:hypothetical protein